MNEFELEGRFAKLEARVMRLENEAGIPHSPQVLAQNPVSQNAETPRRSVETKGGFESFIGGNVLLRAGILAILAAVGFFLKYAFEQHLLSDIVKVFVIALCGAGMIGLGEYFSQKHKLFGQVIIGGGIAVFFFDVVASHLLYNFISASTAFNITFALTALMLLYSLRRDSHPLLISSLSGAYFAPLFINTLYVDGQASNGFILYSFVVTIGALALLQSRHKWTLYGLFPIIGFCLHTIKYLESDFTLWTAGAVIGIQCVAACIGAFFAWGAGTSDEESNSSITAIFTTQLAVTFLLVSFLSSFSTNDYLVPLLCGVIAATILGGLGLFYLKKRQHIPTALWANAALVYLTFGSILYFYQLQIAAILLLLACVFAAFAAIVRRVAIAILALHVTGVAFIYFISHADLFSYYFRPVAPWLNTVTFIFVALIAALAFQAWLSKFYKDHGAKYLGIVALVGAELIGILFMFQQIHLLVETGQKGNIVNSVGLILFGVANVIVGFLRSSRIFRVMGLIILSIAIIKVGLVDLWGLGTLYRITISLILGILLVSSSYLYHKFGDTVTK